MKFIIQGNNKDTTVEMIGCRVLMKDLKNLIRGRAPDDNHFMVVQKIFPETKEVVVSDGIRAWKIKINRLIFST